jgi:hypothetical protein
MSNALYYQDIAPGPTWSYTAGAYYRGQNALGSLIFGGFELGRCTPNGVGFFTSSNTSRPLMVSIRSITTNYSDEEMGLLETPISANIDSGVSELLLPRSICERFHETFELSYDSARDTYFIDKATHSALLKSNPTVTFTLAPLPTGWNINITLPYLAFAQNLRISTNESKLYFPIRGTSNPDSYTLGRTFLQEAYLMVNDEKFTVSQARYPNVPPRIINYPSFPPPKPKAAWKLWARALHAKRRHHRRLSGGAIAGIVIAVVSVIVSLAIVLWIIVRRRMRVMKRMSTAVMADTEERAALGCTDVEMSQKSTTQTKEHATESNNLVSVHPPWLPERVPSPSLEHLIAVELPASIATETISSDAERQELPAVTEKPSGNGKPTVTRELIGNGKPSVNTHLEKVKTGETELNSASPTDSPGSGTRLGRRKSRFSEEFFE